MTEITINGKMYIFPIGTKMSTVMSEIDSIDSQCRQGQCGKCLIEIETGTLGIVNDAEKTFLELMGLNPQKYRLLCQCNLNGKSVVISFEG